MSSRSVLGYRQEHVLPYVAVASTRCFYLSLVESVRREWGRLCLFFLISSSLLFFFALSPLLFRSGFPRTLAQERHASDLEVLSLSAASGGAAAAAGEMQAGGDTEGGQEAPLDSLLASAVEVGGSRKSNAHQASVVRGKRASGVTNAQPTTNKSVFAFLTSPRNSFFCLDFLSSCDAVL